MGAIEEKTMNGEETRTGTPGTLGAGRFVLGSLALAATTFPPHPAGSEWLSTCRNRLLPGYPSLRKSRFCRQIAGNSWKEIHRENTAHHASWSSQ